MAERVNIARIAEIVSADIFSKLGWEAHGVPNESWECNEPTHEKRDHPTDVTFVYQDPYSARNVHLITDLKSYAAGSIKEFSLRETIESLALAVDCAKDNPKWKELYLKAGAEYEIQGLVFIYNHDSEYDKSFPEQLHVVFQDDLTIPRGVKLSIIGPDEVWYLNEMLTDIASLARDEVIPTDKKALKFFYHSHSRSKVVSQDHSMVATIDMLKGKYQMLAYSHANQYGGFRGMLVYYRGYGESEREFIVLIDMLRSFGVLDNYDRILVRSARGCSRAANNFNKAVSQYATYGNHEMLLKKLDYGSIASVRPRLTQFEVALRGGHA
ncbi:hypothetical protein [Paraburkholderia fynbosensis]|uniref:GAPS4 PD-(D/E)XK nuclease domain-containing protein n=1 Tax=Paraburkholderia fynbosensis TaxID=1200993 RepID=A0A6J5H2W1_9BURK|nr:hypothetical protein [Paraburkholderia fynbosensis]CAB3809688.1 hypothetical protein LMG27177_06874 [Paraburkholderia fynbosensis]